MKGPTVLPPGIPHREWENLAWANGHPREGEIHEESTQITDTVGRIVEAFTTLHGSPFLKGGPSGRLAVKDDIVDLQETLRMAVPETEQNRGLYSHLSLAGKFGHAIAREANVHHALDLDAYALNAAGNLNDVGKLTGIFRYHLNDLIGDEILFRIGAKFDVAACFMPVRFNVGPVTLREERRIGEIETKRRVGEYVAYIRNTLSRYQEIFVLADVCGKAKKPDFREIQTFAEMEEIHMATRKSPADYASYIGKEALWPSEQHAYRHLPGFAEGWLSIYRALKDKWKAQGADVDEIRKRLQDSPV